MLESLPRMNDTLLSPAIHPNKHPVRGLFLLMIIGLLMVVQAPAPFAATRLEQDRARLDSLRAALDALQKLESELANREVKDLQKLDRTQRALSSTQRLIQELQAHGERLEQQAGRTRVDLDFSSRTLDSLTQALKKNQAEHRKLLAETRNVITQVWRNRRQDPFYWLLASGTVGEAFRRARWFPWFGQGVQKGALELKESERTLLTLENATSREKQRQSNLLSDLTASQAEAEASRNENQRRAGQLDRERGNLDQTLTRIRNDRTLQKAKAEQASKATETISEQVKALEDRWRKRQEQKESEAAGRENLSRILKEKEGADPSLPAADPSPRVEAPAPVVTPAPRETAPASLPEGSLSDLRPLRGRVPKPVTGTVRKRWGLHKDPVSGTETDNPGIDYRCRPGDPVRLVHAGKVVRTTWVPGFGNTVLVDHGSGVFSVYSKLESVNPLPDHTLKTGTLIGQAGSFDEPGEGSLHFELWLGRESQNPELWLQR
jgi:septal ring factor EnvC (AmiA/AmiB activator)